MKTFIICKEPFPYGMAATQRIICYAKALMMKGIECEVILFLRHEKGRSRINAAAKGLFESVPFRYCGGSSRKPTHKLTRILAERFDKEALYYYLKSNLNDGDAVLAYFHGDIPLQRTTINLTHRKGAKYVRELCEIPYFGDTSRASQKGLETTLNVIFPKCDGFISISDNLTELAQKYKNPDARIVKIPILIDFEQANVPDRSDEAEVPYIIHTGTLSERKDGIVGMITAFAQARKRIGRPVKFLFAGDIEASPDKEAILKAISDNDLADDVKFLGYLTYSQIREHLAKASFALVNKPDNIQNRYGFSTKLAGYLAAGKAIVITKVGEAMNWLEDGQNAWIVPNEDTTAMADAIVKAFSDEKECRRMGEDGRKLCEECFDYRQNAGRLSDFIKSL